MSDSIVRDTIAAELALVERVAPTPAAPFGVGTDMSCGTDLAEDMADVAGSTTLALGQAIVRRLDCPRGELPDDPDYGIGLRQMLNRGTVADDLRALADMIRAELQKDDRIDSLVVSVAPSSEGSSLAVTLAIAPVDASIGPFTLTLAVSSAEILIEALA